MISRMSTPPEEPMYSCGNETNLTPKGDIKRVGSVVTTAEKDFLLDIVGRYTVTIGGKSYDTVCVMDVEPYDCGVVSEQCAYFQPLRIGAFDRT